MVWCLFPSTRIDQPFLTCYGTPTEVVVTQGTVPPLIFVRPPGGRFRDGTDPLPWPRFQEVVSPRSVSLRPEFRDERYLRDRKRLPKTGVYMWFQFLKGLH